MAIAVMWFRSYTSYEGVGYASPGFGDVQLYSTGGQMLLYRNRNATRTDGLRAFSESNTDEDLVEPFRWYGRFGATRFNSAAWQVAVPHWTLAGLLAIVIGCRLWKSHQQFERERAGLCPSCGYDLRATPERCPECGAAPEPTAKPAA
ncbi:MAG TPA: hypothetical protein VGR35_02285 [Tepidisphaeraceae bacterium]|nr:hypothetical protein [Tepidisphaeraceae bacterium]